MIVAWSADLPGCRLQMTAPLSNLRFERKFVADGFTLAEVLAVVHRHPSAFREVYPPRVVNNLYLDSPTRRDYHDHVNGAANRTKTRVRWYGPQFEVVDRSALERKVKRGLVSGKETYALAQFSAGLGGLCSRLGSAFEAASLPGLLRAELKHKRPALLNRYRRHYFLSRDTRFRLTVDHQLQFARVPMNHRPAVGLSPSTTTLILELKFRPEVAEEAQAVTATLPFRLARFSKYVAGVERL
jgi:hypothetical protein